MTDSAAAFGWTKWPFHVVADEEFAHVWADRAALRTELDKRLRRLSSLPHSTVQIMWADFGAGKSHALRRIQARCVDDPKKSLRPVYTEVPAGTEGLLDLYRSLASSLTPDATTQIGELLRRGSRRLPTTPGARDLRQALKLSNSDDVGAQAVAIEWLQASPGVPHLRSLKAYGVSARIESDLRAVEVMTELISLLRECSLGSAIIWLIDEFQRIADVPTRKREAFAKSIVSLFNSCPSGLHFVLSFSVAQQETALALIPPDLRSRAATFPMLMLPNMNREDCVTFALDLFGAFRAGSQPDPHYPFTKDSLDHVVGSLEDESAGVVTPRLLMERLETVLFELYDAADGKPLLPADRAAVAGIVAARTEKRD